MIIAIANQIIGSQLYTGGDILSFEVLKRSEYSKTVILAPLSIQKYIKNNSNNIDVIPTDYDEHYNTFGTTIMVGFSTIYRYIIRIFRSIIILEKNLKDLEVLYLTGDFICNSIPAIYIKIRKKRVKLILNFYHRNPKSRDRGNNMFIFSFVSRILQTVSLSLVRSYVYKVFVLSTIGKEELEMLRYDSNKIVVTGGGGNNKYLTMQGINTNKLMDIKRKSNDILVVGRLSRTKGIFDIPKILSGINTKNKWKLNIAGIGHKEDIEIFQKELKKYNLEDRVNILGFVSEQKKWELLAASKIFILTSHEEGYSLVVHEALLAKCRVVAYKLDSLYSIFSDYDVHFIEEFNKDQFSIKVNELMDSTHIPGSSLMRPQSWNELAAKQYAEI
jgi:glycosyltransferase involved in cell wall biosynthesis